MPQAEKGKVFREAWIAGVKKHYPGEPKPGYMALWEETPNWERESATAVYDQVRSFIETTDGQTAKLSRTQKGRFVALCWIGQIFRHFPDSKPSYVADWDDLPQWQQETDADIFERIEQAASLPLDQKGGA
jgi:broad specificity phosphatase PhoE